MPKHLTKAEKRKAANKAQLAAKRAAERKAKLDAGKLACPPTLTSPTPLTRVWLQRDRKGSRCPTSRLRAPCP